MTLLLRPVQDIVGGVIADLATQLVTTVVLGALIIYVIVHYLPPVDVAGTDDTAAAASTDRSAPTATARVGAAHEVPTASDPN